MPITTYDPLVGFKFRVSIPKLTGSVNDTDLGFMKVSGLEADVGIFEWAEMSDPVTSFKFPDRIKFSDLVLERGVITAPYGATALWSWFNGPYNSVTSLLETGDPGFLRRDVEIVVVPKGYSFSDSNRVLRWRVFSAFPKNIKFGELNATTSAVHIESMTLANEGYSFLG